MAGPTSLIPNALSLLRIALAPLAVYYLHQDAAGGWAATLVLMVAAGATDVLDGLAARTLGQSSRLGRILDPVADKVFIGAVGAGLVLWRGFPLWLLAAQLARDVAIVGAGLFLLRSRRLVVSSSGLGKAATWAMGFALLGALMGGPGWIRQTTVWTAAALLVLSSVDYLRVLYRIAGGTRRG
ncbi:MAG: CDP-alcohol phosphatidyltransferase family protein [Gemmatimonadota bacterium]